MLLTTLRAVQYSTEFIAMPQCVMLDSDDPAPVRGRRSTYHSRSARSVWDLGRVATVEISFVGD